MPTYYFDSVNGNDANTGASWGQAFRGNTKQIASYIATGNIVWLRGSWDNQIGGTFSGLSSFELRVHDDGAVWDCRTRQNSGWSNVLGSRVWKKSYTYQVHRLFLGSGSATGFTEGNDVGKRYIVSTSGSWTTTAATDSQVVAGLDAGAVDQMRFWYWDGVSSTLYVRSTSSSVDPDTAYSGVWTVDGYLGAAADRRRAAPLYFTGCPSLYLGPVEMRGAVEAMTVEDCSGTLEPFITDFPHYQWRTLRTSGSPSASTRTLTINSPRILQRRPYFDEYFSYPGFNDGNGLRDMGGADVVTVENRWASWSMYGGTIEGGVHTGVGGLYFHDTYLTAGLIQGTHFDLRNLRYGRALGFQQSSTGRITSMVVERITVDGQPTHSQVNWDNLTIRNSVWRHGRNGWIGDGTGPNYVDKYDPTANWAGRWRNSSAINIRPDIVASTGMVIEDNIFLGQRDEVLTLDFAQSATYCQFRNNWCIRVPADAGPYGNTIVQNYGSAAATYSGNEYDGYSALGYTTISSGFSTMSGAELTLYTARGEAHTFTLSPSPATPAVGASQSVTVTVANVSGVAVQDFSGTVATSSDTAVATVTGPSSATTSTGQTSMSVDGIYPGTASVLLRAIQGAAAATLPVTVGGTATGVSVVQSAIGTTEGGASVTCTMSGLTPGNRLVAFVGGYFDGASTVVVSDTQTPAGTWAQQAGVFRTGGPSSSIGAFASLGTVGTSTTSITVTATPSVPTVTNAFVSLVLVEVTGAATSSTVQISSIATGQSATPTVDLPSLTAPALVLGGASQSGVGTPTIAAGAGFTLLQAKNGNAGLGVVSRRITTAGEYDPAWVLTSTVGGIPSYSIEWPAVAVVLNEEPDTPAPPEPPTPPPPEPIPTPSPNLAAGTAGGITMVPPRAPLADANGMIQRDWYRLLANLVQDSPTTREMANTKRRLCSVVLSASPTVLYTAPALTRTTINAAVLTNTTASPITVTVWLVPSGGVPATSNAAIYSLTVAARESRPCPEVVEQVIEPGGTLQAQGEGLTMIVTGTESNA